MAGIDALLKRTTVNLGQISFINCAPINYPLAKKLEKNPSLSEEFNIISSVPAEMNKALRAGDIDLAPISSYEYLTNKDKYELLGGLSISSKQEADSVLFFSNEKLEDIKTVNVTDKSATSVALLKTLFKELYELPELDFKKFSSAEDHASFSNKLLIGDEALLEKPENYKYIYDLGLEWYKLTKLPMVFGVWAYNKDSLLAVDSKLLESVKELLISSKEEGLGKYFPDLLIDLYSKTGISKKKLEAYFNHLDYSLEAQHLESLEKFEKLCR